MQRPKRAAMVLLLVLSLTVLSGCSNKGPVAAVIYGHVASLRQGTVRESTELWTDEAKASGRRMAEVFARFAIPRPAGARIVSLKISQDTAKVTAVWYYRNDLRPETYIYLLEKDERKWKIAGCSPITQPLD